MNELLELVRVVLCPLLCIIKWIFLPPHPLTNFETQKYQNEPKFDGVYSRDNLPKIKDGAHIIYLDEYSDIGTHWVALYIHNNNATYFDSFGVEHIPKEIKEFVKNKNVIANIFRLQAYDSIMCGYFCIGFIDFMLAGKKLTEYTNLFSRNNFKENEGGKKIGINEVIKCNEIINNSLK